jgi:hypothetical protein
MERGRFTRSLSLLFGFKLTYLVYFRQIGRNTATQATQNVRIGLTFSFTRVARVMSNFWVCALFSMLIFSCAFSASAQSGENLSRSSAYPDKFLFDAKGIEKFSKSGWLKDSLKDRRDMLFDLVHTYPLIGMTRAEIHALLGPPSSSDPLLEKGLNISDFDPYDVGHDYYFSLKYSKDRVVAFRIDRTITGCILRPGRFLSQSSYWYTENFSMNSKSEPHHSSSIINLSASDLPHK